VLFTGAISFAECSKSLKEEYYKDFLAQLRKIVYGDQDISMDFINYIMNQIS
jgi:hypothetical protein